MRKRDLIIGWLYGHFEIHENLVEVKPEFESVKGFNFWVAEGLIGLSYNEKGLKIPKINTPRQLTRKLYDTVHDIKCPREYKISLFELLRSTENAATVILNSTYLAEDEIRNAANGRVPGELRIINNGKVSGPSHTTYFQNPNTQQCFRLTNAEGSVEGQREGLVIKADEINFRHIDKICERSSLFYDGSIEDIFIMLKERGVDFDEGIIV